MADEARDLAEREHLAFIETSALTNDGVDTAFTRILEEIYAIHKERELAKGEEEEDMVVTRTDRVELAADEKEAEAPKSGGCCK